MRAPFAYKLTTYLFRIIEGPLPPPQPPSSAGYYEALGPLPPVSSIQPGMAEMSPLAMTRHGSPDSGIGQYSPPPQQI